MHGGKLCLGMCHVHYAIRAAMLLTAIVLRHVSCSIQSTCHRVWFGMLVSGHTCCLLFQHSCHSCVSISTCLGWGTNPKAPVASSTSSTNSFRGKRWPIVFRFWWGYRLIRSTCLGRRQGFVITRSENKEARGYSSYTTGMATPDTQISYTNTIFSHKHQAKRNSEIWNYGNFKCTLHATK